MATFKEIMTYKPPDIRLFKEWGHGYLAVADSAVDLAESAYYESRVKLHDDPTWGSEPQDIPRPDLVEMYGYLGMADAMLKTLQRMEEPERKKQLALDTNEELERTLPLVLRRHADLVAKVVQWEQEAGDVLYTALDRQLARRLDTWGKGLKRVGEDNFEDEDEPFGSIGDFCRERDVIEYAVMSIHNLRYARDPRLKALPHFDALARRRLKLDEIFRRVLNGRFLYAPWAELPQFWWHHSPKDVEQFIKNREKRVAKK